MFLSHLAIAGKESASTRNPAKSVLRFLYRQVLKINEPWLTDVAGAPGQAFTGGADSARCGRGYRVGCGLIHGAQITPLLVGEHGVVFTTRRCSSVDERHGSVNWAGQLVTIIAIRITRASFS